MLRTVTQWEPVHPLVLQTPWEPVARVHWEPVSPLVLQTPWETVARVQREAVAPLVLQTVTQWDPVAPLVLQTPFLLREPVARVLNVVACLGSSRS